MGDELNQAIAEARSAHKAAAGKKADERWRLAISAALNALIPVSDLMFDAGYAAWEAGRIQRKDCSSYLGPQIFEAMIREVIKYGETAKDIG